jgi:hypothetical protein
MPGKGCFREGAKPTILPRAKTPSPTVEILVLTKACKTVALKASPISLLVN